MKSIKKNYKIFSPQFKVPFFPLKTFPLPCGFVTSLLSLVVHFENWISFHFRAKLVIWRLENGRSRKRNPIKSERSASYKMGWRKQGKSDMTISYTRKVRKGWSCESTCPSLMHPFSFKTHLNNLGHAQNWTIMCIWVKYTAKCLLSLLSNTY